MPLINNDALILSLLVSQDETLTNEEIQSTNLYIVEKLEEMSRYATFDFALITPEERKRYSDQNALSTFAIKKLHGIAYQLHNAEITYTVQLEENQVRIKFNSLNDFNKAKRYFFTKTFVVHNNKDIDLINFLQLVTENHQQNVAIATTLLDSNDEIIQFLLSATGNYQQGPLTIPLLTDEEALMLKTYLATQPGTFPYTRDETSPAAKAAYSILKLLRHKRFILVEWFQQHGDKIPSWEFRFNGIDHRLTVANHTPIDLFEIFLEEKAAEMLLDILPSRPKKILPLIEQPSPIPTEQIKPTETLVKAEIEKNPLDQLERSDAHEKITPPSPIDTRILDEKIKELFTYAHTIAKDHPKKSATIIQEVTQLKDAITNCIALNAIDDPKNQESINQTIENCHRIFGRNRKLQDILAHIVIALTGIGFAMMAWQKYSKQTFFLNETTRQKKLHEVDVEVKKLFKPK